MARSTRLSLVLVVTALTACAPPDQPELVRRRDERKRRKCGQRRLSRVCTNMLTCDHLLVRNNTPYYDMGRPIQQDVDPLFMTASTNPTAADVSLQIGSPAIDSGSEEPPCGWNVGALERS